MSNTVDHANFLVAKSGLTWFASTTPNFFNTTSLKSPPLPTTTYSSIVLFPSLDSLPFATRVRSSTVNFTLLPFHWPPQRGATPHPLHISPWDTGGSPSSWSVQRKNRIPHMRGVSESMMKRKYCHPILQERGLSCGFPEIEDGVGQKKSAN